MPKEHLKTDIQESFSKFSGVEISQFFDGFVDFQIPHHLLIEIKLALQSGRNLALITNHQGYLEIEIERRVCQELNQVSEKPITALLFFSAPAVSSNVENILKIRQPIYQQCGLNLLGIVRGVDKTNKYKDHITPEMASQSRQSLQFYSEALKKGGCLIFKPFEATLKGGRINPETGEIYGIHPNKEDSLIGLIDGNILLLPCGIDGSYKIIDSDTHQLTQIAINSLKYGHPPEKPVSCKIGEIIDPEILKNINLSPSEIAHKTVVEVAKLVSGPAQGAYRQECLDSLK